MLKWLDLRLGSAFPECSFWEAAGDGLDKEFLDCCKLWWVSGVLRSWHNYYHCFYKREDFQGSQFYHYGCFLIFKNHVLYAVNINFALFFLILDTLEIASVNLPIPVQAKNYYKNISDNKEIVKLVSVLSTIINSTKKVCWEDLQPGLTRGCVALSSDRPADSPTPSPCACREQLKPLERAEQTSV